MSLSQVALLAAISSVTVGCICLYRARRLQEWMLVVASVMFFTAALLSISLACMAR
jgi:hypothetical protein